MSALLKIMIAFVLIFSVVGGALGIVGFVKSKASAVTVQTAASTVSPERKAFDYGAEHLYVQSEIAGLTSKAYVSGELLALSSKGVTYLCPLNTTPSSGLCTTVSSTGKPVFAGVPASLPPVIQTGNVQVTAGVANIVFPTPFATIPVVTATAYQTGLNPQQYTFSTIITAVTTTGATVLVQYTPQGSSTNGGYGARLMWQAIAGNST